MKLFGTTQPKKYERTIFKHRIVYTFIKCFRKNFGSQSLGIEIQQNNQKFQVFNAFLLNSVHISNEN